MKQTNRIMNWVLACGLAFAMFTTTAAQAAERTGKVVRLKGAARASTGNNVWQPVKVGDVLKAGTLIQTASDSYVDIVLGESNLTPVRAVATTGAGYKPKADQDMVRVQADSTLGLDKLSVINTGSDQVTDTQLDLRSGRVFGSVKKMNATSRYEIKLPNGVAAVRGTVYMISADGVVQVLSGTVVISWMASDGSVVTQTVNGGYQFDARTGLVTPIPSAVLSELERLLRDMALGPSGPTTFPIEDGTIYFVSPTAETAANGGGNGNGGEGNGEGPL